MEKFPEKLRTAREKAHIHQTDLAEKVGVTRRSIFAYENGESTPRTNVLRKLADALDVTVTYLIDDETNDPNEGRVREDSINTVREQFGSKGAREAAELLERNSAFFAGGDMPQEDKDAFFDAIMIAYVTAKKEAQKKYTPKALQKTDDEA